MKTYNEMAENALRRIEEHEKDKRKKQKIIARTLPILSICLVALLGVGVWLSAESQTVVLDSGEKIRFEKIEKINSVQWEWDEDIVSRKLTAEETGILFPDSSVSAAADFSKDEQKLIRISGKIDGVKFIIGAPGIPLSDTVIDSKVSFDGAAFSGGVFITEANSKGEKAAIYYMNFKIGENNCYAENSGAVDDGEATKNELTAVINKLVKYGEIDFDKIKL